MTKGIVITHGNLGRELIKVAEKILERKVELECICFDWQADGSEVIAKIDKYLKKFSQKKVIIFTDMFGGSPSNISQKYLNSKVEIITGINLPGLLKFLTYRNKNIEFEELTKIVKDEAQNGINRISEYLGEKK